MTATSVLDRPRSTAQSSAPSTSPFGAWRLAARLARREVRRRPGRTALVMLMVVVPVIGMTLGSVLLRSDINRWTSNGLFGGGANHVIASGLAPIDVAPIDVDARFRPSVTAEELRSVVGDRGHVLDMVSVFSTFEGPTFSEAYFRLIERPDGLRPSDVDVALVFDRGRMPTADGEALLSREVAETVGASVGDQLDLTRPERSWTVVGIARSRDNFSDAFAVVGRIDRDDVRPNRLGTELVVVPDPDLGRRALDGLFDDVSRVSGGAIALGPDLLDYDVSPEESQMAFWGWVAGVVALMATGVVAAAAFATSARRQLVTVAQLSANGAPERVIARTLALQGSWTGLFAAIVGIAIAVVAAVLGWSLVEEVAGRELPDREIRLFDLLVIGITATVAATIAAALPARSAARVPVLTALAGRRPVGSLPTWIAPLGIGALVTGVALFAVVGTSDAATSTVTLVALLGAAAIIVGLVCVAPVLIAITMTLAANARGGLLVAARSLGRQRTRSAAVIAAVAVVMALATAILTGVAVSRADAAVQGIHSRSAIIELITTSSGSIEGAPAFPGDTDTRISEIIPAAQRSEIARVALPTADASRDIEPLFAYVVENDNVAALFGLDAETSRTLDRSGAALVGHYGRDIAESVGSIDTVIEGTGSFALWSPALVTPAWVADHGLSGSVTAVAYVADEPFDSEQVDDLQLIARDLSPGWIESAFLSVDDRVEFDSFSEPTTPFWSVNAPWLPEDVPWALIQTIALAVVLLIVVGVVAAGLALAAAESREERYLLSVSGARPSLLRRVAAAKAGIQTVAAAVVAVPVGWSVVWVIRATDGGSAGVGTPVPWTAVGALVVLIPVGAAVCAWVGSGVASQFRPVTASRSGVG